MLKIYNAPTFTILTLCLALTQAFAIEDSFNPTPKLDQVDKSGFMATSEQRDLFKTAEKTLGDGLEDAPIQACRDIIADKTASEDLRRWANLRLVKLYTYTNQEQEALRVGLEWLDANPNYIRAQDIRIDLARMLRDRRHHEGFEPTVDEVIAFNNEVFEKSDSKNLDVLQQHLRYVTWLHCQVRDEDAIAQLELIAEGCRAIMASPPRPPDWLSLLERANWLDAHKNDAEKARKLLEETIEPTIRVLKNPWESPSFREEYEKSLQHQQESIEQVVSQQAGDEAAAELLGEGE